MENKVEIPGYGPRLSSDNVDVKMSGFSVTRIINGEVIPIRLTNQELYAAHSYQEQEFYEDDVEMVLEELEADGELNGHTAAEIIDRPELLGPMVAEYTRNRDKYNMEWHEAAYQAIKAHIKNAGV